MLMWHNYRQSRLKLSPSLSSSFSLPCFFSFLTWANLLHFHKQIFGEQRRRVVLRLIKFNPGQQVKGVMPRSRGPRSSTQLHAAPRSLLLPRAVRGNCFCFFFYARVRVKNTDINSAARCSDKLICTAHGPSPRPLLRS